MFYCPSPKYLFYSKGIEDPRGEAREHKQVNGRPWIQKSRLLAPKTGIPPFHYSVRKLNAMVESVDLESK